MKYKHIIWDFDGTLFDTYPVMASVFKEYLKAIGIDEPLEKIYSLMKVSMGYAIEHYTKLYPITDAFLNKYNTECKNAEKNLVKPFDGAVNLCRKIYDRGGKNYLFTHRGVSTFFFFEKFGLDKYFTELITSNNNFLRKPSPDAILYLIKKYRFLPEEAIMIGDRDLDIQSANNAGICSCYFQDSGKPFDAADFNISNLLELYNLLCIKNS